MSQPYQQVLKRFQLFCKLLEVLFEFQGVTRCVHYQCFAIKVKKSTHARTRARTRTNSFYSAGTVLRMCIKTHVTETISSVVLTIKCLHFATNVPVPTFKPVQIHAIEKDLKIIRT